MSITALLHKKEQLAQELRNVEKQIFDLEGSYLEENASSGNVLKGWEGYLTAPNRSLQSTLRKSVKDSDRIFSLSSLTSPQVNAF